MFQNKSTRTPAHNISEGTFMQAFSYGEYNSWCIPDYRISGTPDYRISGTSDIVWKGLKMETVKLRILRANNFYKLFNHMTISLLLRRIIIRISAMLSAQVFFPCEMKHIADLETF